MGTDGTVSCQIQRDVLLLKRPIAQPSGKAGKVGHVLFNGGGSALSSDEGFAVGGKRLVCNSHGEFSLCVSQFPEFLRITVLLPYKGENIKRK